MSKKPATDRTKLDAAALKSQLGPDAPLPPDITAREARLASLELARLAHRRMTMNQSGALPGPPIARPSLTRVVIRWLQRIAGQHYPS